MWIPSCSKRFRSKTALSWFLSISSSQTNFLTMMPNFWMSMKVRSYPMSHKMWTDLQTILMSYLALKVTKQNTELNWIILSAYIDKTKSLQSILWKRKKKNQFYLESYGNNLFSLFWKNFIFCHSLQQLPLDTWRKKDMWLTQ